MNREILYMPAEAHSTFFYGYRNKKRMVAVNEKGTLHFIKTIRILHVFTHLKKIVYIKRYDTHVWRRTF
jgi:hypothetical protein